MTSLFDALKQEVLAVERDPALDTGAAAVALLQEWLASHEAEISARKLAAPTEFNGTLMQWFHWYSEGGWRPLAAAAPGGAGPGRCRHHRPVAAAGRQGLQCLGCGLRHL